MKNHNIITKGIEKVVNLVKDVDKYNCTVENAKTEFWGKHKALGIGLLIGATAVELYSNGTFDGIKTKVKELNKKTQTFEVYEVVHSNDYRLTKYAKAYLKSSRDVAITTFAQPVKCHHAGDEYYKLMTYDNCYDFNKHTVVGIVVKMVEKTDAYALVQVDYFDADMSAYIKGSECFLLLPKNDNTTTGSINK